MTNLREKIDSLIGSDVRVYFKSACRRPVFGRFLKESDYEHLKGKGMFRFKLLQNLDNNDLSKIYDSEAIFDVVKY
jgi:hypothetical protein